MTIPVSRRPSLGTAGDSPPAPGAIPSAAEHSPRGDGSVWSAGLRTGAWVEWAEHAGQRPTLQTATPPAQSGSQWGFNGRTAALLTKLGPQYNGPQEVARTGIPFNGIGWNPHRSTAESIVEVVTHEERADGTIAVLADGVGDFGPFVLKRAGMGELLRESEMKTALLSPRAAPAL